jgi:hypothetical protein
MKYALPISVAVVVTASTFLFAAKPAVSSPSPILIKQCFVTQPKPFSKTAGGTQIDYVNHGTKTAHSVTFLVGYRNAASNFLRRQIDYGSFSSGQEISHHFALFSDVTYAGHATSSCRAIAVKWSDGTQWTGQ